MRSFLIILFYFVCFSACKPPLRTGTPVSTKYRIHGDSLKLFDSSIYYIIAPYKSRLDPEMNKEVATVTDEFRKAQPSGTLCNLVADATFRYASEHSDKKIDFAVLNYGVIRNPVLRKGTVTKRDLYELIPFENEIVVLRMSGKTVLQFLNHIATKGGWPVSGLKMTITNGRAFEILIQDQPLDTNRMYSMATTDYLTEGGDGSFMLKNVNLMDPLHYLLRNAVGDYLKTNRSPVEEERIRNEH